MSIALAVILIFMALAWGVLIGLAIGLVYCARLGDKAHEPVRPTETSRREPTEAELARIEAERQQLIEDNRAFQAMLAYNTSMAYGMAKGDKKG